MDDLQIAWRPLGELIPYARNPRTHGAGSTVIACEKAGRQARLIELDPKYCDVIVRRWQEFSGDKAALDGDGRSFDEIVAETDAVAA